MSTNRLLLRPLELADADALQQVFPRWEIVRFLGVQVPWPYPADGALSFIRDVVLSAMARGVEWHWTIRPQVSPRQLIGGISLLDKPDDNRAFWLDPMWQGRGLMSEASGGLRSFGSRLWGGPFYGCRRPRQICRPDASPESGGMRLVGMEKDYLSGQLPTEVWEITREEWRRQRGQ